MANYYIQANTFNGALQALSDNTRSGHYITGNISYGFGSYISYSSSTGHNFTYAKQLTYNTATPPVATGFNNNAIFDDFPSDKFNFKQFMDILADKEFLCINSSAHDYFFYNYGYVCTPTKALELDWPCCLGGCYNMSGFAGDSNFPFSKIFIGSAWYYNKFFRAEDESNRVRFKSYNYPCTLTGEQGFYSLKYGSSLSEIVSISGAYYRIIQGADGAPGPPGADGVDGIDGINGLDAPMPDLSGIELALEKLSNLDKLQKYDDMLVKFDKIIKVLCRFLSWNIDNPDDLRFLTAGEDVKNADNLRDLLAVLASETDPESEYPALFGAVAELMPLLSVMITKAKQKITEIQ